MLFQMARCLFYYNLLSECINSETTFFFLWHHKGNLQPFASNQLASFWYLTPSFHNPKPYPHFFALYLYVCHIKALKGGVNVIWSSLKQN